MVLLARTQGLNENICSGSAFSKSRGHAPHAANTELPRQNFLNETFFSILADDKEQQGGAGAQRPRDLVRSALEHSVSRAGDLPGASVAW
jgi:hypothetical protein